MNNFNLNLIRNKVQIISYGSGILFWKFFLAVSNYNKFYSANTFWGKKMNSHGIIKSSCHIFWDHEFPDLAHQFPKSFALISRLLWRAHRKHLQSGGKP